MKAAFLKGIKFSRVYLMLVTPFCIGLIAWVLSYRYPPLILVVIMCGTCFAWALLEQIGKLVVYIAVVILAAKIEKKFETDHE